ncbi:MAG: hypothetical protein IIA14_07920 [SAR324 cluster bacterium]|nr:hypothetical protein [SAR324 cluster bacterium]
MRFRKPFFWIVFLVALSWIPLAQRPVFAAETLLEYGVDLVSNYVFRGDDLFVAKFAENQKPQGGFNTAPALQPSLTFPAPGGFSLGLWGSFALTNRDRDDPNTAVSEANLGSLDELDITLDYSWDNRLGSFSAGYVVYTLTNPRGGANLDEIYFRWGFPFMEALGPTLSHNAAASGIGQYTALVVGGGEILSWGVSIANGLRDIPGSTIGGPVGIVNGIQDITANVGYAFGDFSLSLTVANRPKALLHDFDGLPDGKFTDPKTGKLESIPGNLIWLTFSYGGSVEG